MALETYREKATITCHPTLDAAKAGLVTEWAKHTTLNPDKTTLILAYTNQDVFELNAKARDYPRATGAVSATEHRVHTERGPRQFADGDRIIFLRNERSMGVKNASLGTILKFS